MRKIFILTALAVLMLGACKKKDITPDNQGKDPEVEQGDFSFKLEITKGATGSFITERDDRDPGEQKVKMPSSIKFLAKTMLFVNMKKVMVFGYL